MLLLQLLHLLQQAARAFERYDLVSAAVIDEAGKIVGRVTVDRVVDYIRSKSESDLLTARGLRAHVTVTDETDYAASFVVVESGPNS